MFSDNRLYVALGLLIVVFLLSGIALVCWRYVKLSRKVNDSDMRESFRKIVRAVHEKLPSSNDFWDNEFIKKLPYLSEILDREVARLLPCLSPERSAMLEKEWSATRDFIENKLAIDLLMAEQSTGGTIMRIHESKKKLHMKLESLLKYSY
jgi:hypothetical protein